MNSIKFKPIIFLMIIIGMIVFSVAVVLLILGDTLDVTLNVIGIRIATLFVAFSSFLSSTLFSLLILYHNRTVSRINDDTNRRAELFRELQFASSNYSIIEFMDRMLIYDESSRYVDRFILKRSMMFHMISPNVKESDVYDHPSDFNFISVKIPFRVIEGRMVSNITFKKLKFERGDEVYHFVTPQSLQESRAFLLYNEYTKRNNVIINLIVPKDSPFFDKSSINDFSKIKISINVTSLLGVRVRGISELYFTNPEQIEGGGRNTYRINSSNFTLMSMPVVTQLYPKQEKNMT